MSKLILNPEFLLYEQKGVPFCDSLQVAEEFKKRHDNVLQDIERKILGVADPTFTDLNFQVSAYKDSSGKRSKKYLMTKDGFLLLAMGFTGEKAMRFKIAFINRFNGMEEFIKSLLTTKIEFPAFTNAVMMAHDEPKHYHFSNEINMIYRVVLGMTAKDFRAKHDLPKGASIRPYLTNMQIKAVEELQRTDIGLMVVVSDFHERKDVLAQHFERLKDSHLLLTA